MPEDGAHDTCVQTGALPQNGGGASDSDGSPCKGGPEGGTPTRRNKRKMTEPKKRSDFSIKRFCPDSPGSPSDPEDREAGGAALRTFPRGPQILSPIAIRPGRHPDVLAGRELSREMVEGGLAYPHLAVPMYPHHPGGAVVTTLVPRPGPSGSASSTSSETPSMRAGPSRTPDSSVLDSLHGSPKSARKQRKNYKNMTRERRVDANARERSRVHTISAAFESLRRAVPSYSYNQRLSKLAILRIACSYILSLATLADLDYSKDQDKHSFADCVDMCTKTIQSEGRTKRRH